VAGAAIRLHRSTPASTKALGSKLFVITKLE
jgi:hypothetical protein